MGAELNAGTGKEATSLYARVLDRHLERAFDVMRDMVWRPRFGDLDAEREVVLEEIAMYEDDPQDLVFDVLGEAVFGTHPLGRAVIGRAEVVGAATREQLRAFHAERYCPGEHRDRRRRLGRPRRARRDGAERSADGERPGAPPSGTAAASARAARARRSRDARLRAPRALPAARTPSSTTSASAARGIARDDERRFALRVLDRRPRRQRPPRGCSRRCASSAASPTRSSPSPASTPHTGEVGLYVGTRPENLAEALAVVAAELERCVARAGRARRSSTRSRENLKGRVVLAHGVDRGAHERLGQLVLPSCRSSRSTR